MAISKIYKISSEEFKILCDNSSSLKEILSKLGLGYRGHCYDILKRRINEENITFKGTNPQHIKYKNIEEILCENSPYVSTNSLKHRLLSEKIIKNICNECGSLPIHNHKPLVLQLDHINGKSNDNRIENLRMLCPNCHSQTLTYSGKNSKNNIYRTNGKLNNKSSEKILNNSNSSVKIGNKLISISELKILCENNYFDTIVDMFNVDKKTLRSKIKKYSLLVADRPKKRKFEVSKEELERLIKEIPMTKIGKKFGVSDNAIKKRCETLGIEIGNRLGYWAKYNSKSNVDVAER